MSLQDTQLEIQLCLMHLAQRETAGQTLISADSSSALAGVWVLFLDGACQKMHGVAASAWAMPCCMLVLTGPLWQRGGQQSSCASSQELSPFALSRSARIAVPSDSVVLRELLLHTVVM